MKKLFILLGIALLPAALIAQSKKVKVYAYKQDVLPGVRKTTIDESGSTREVSAKMNVNSLLYLEIPLGKKVEPKHVWINGKLYDVNASSPTLPVVMYNTSFPGKKPDTLVHTTSNKVLQLSITPSNDTFKPSSTAKKKMKSNELVLHTIENGKNCYYYVDHMKKLDPVALQ